MKTVLFTILSLLFGLVLKAQESYQQQLFPTDQVLSNRAEIGLDDAQYEAVKNIYGDHIKPFTSLKSNLEKAQLALKKELEQSSVDEDKASGLMKQITQIESELKQLRLRMLVKVKNQLTPEQQERLKDIAKTKEDANAQFATSLSKQPRISIKGTGSKSGPKPMFVFFDSKGNRVLDRKISVDDLNPNQIESVTVLKGKSARKQYGKEGKNGIIEITLKEN